MSSFVDIVRIKLKAGDGGDGKVSFHREKFVQAGGPDGGDGGRGGDIVFVADPGMHTLLDFRYNRKFFAEAGAPGGAGRASGKSGADLVIKVPPGTIVRDLSNDKVLADVREPNVPRAVLHGGRGGWGNSHFANSIRQAPSFAKPGVRTKVFDVQLELKTIADVGLVGFPNVGKSTILSVLTAAKPKIANYHFTTLLPNLGVVKARTDGFVLADIPGLIEGASEGAGLGYEFLRHVERTRLLLHVLDISGSEGRDPLEDREIINRELSRYKELDKKPQILVCNKMDLPGAEENLARLKEAVQGTDTQIFAVSAATAQGFAPLVDACVRALSQIPPVESFEEESAADEFAAAPPLPCAGRTRTMSSKARLWTRCFCACTWTTPRAWRTLSGRFAAWASSTRFAQRARPTATRFAWARLNSSSSTNKGGLFHAPYIETARAAARPFQWL